MIGWNMKSGIPPDTRVGDEDKESTGPVRNIRDVLAADMLSSWVSGSKIGELAQDHAPLPV